MIIKEGTRYEIDMRNYRKQMILAAAQLCYDNAVIQKIRKAESVDEITKIMTNARKEKK